MDSTAMSWREHIRQNMRLALPLMIGVWGGLLLGLSVASLILTMRMMRAMRRIRDGGRILLA